MPKKSKHVTVGKYAHVVGRKWEDHEITALADEFLDWMEADPERIWFRDFLTGKRMSMDTVARIRDRNKYFQEIFNLVKDIQESRLVSMGLDRSKSSAFIIFALKNVAGWRDSKELASKEEENNDFELIDDWPSQGKARDQAAKTDGNKTAKAGDPAG